MKEQIQKYIPYLISFAAGMILMFFVYPSKKIEEKYKSEYDKQVQQLEEKSSQTVSDLNKTHDQEMSNLNQTLSSYKLQVESLNLKVTEMSSHTVETTSKVTKTDGSVEEKTYKESEEASSQKMVSELKSNYEGQIQQLNIQWQQTLDTEKTRITQQYEDKISILEKEKQTVEQSKVTETNVKKIGIEAGIMSDKSTYIHTTYDVFGPVFIGGQVQEDFSANKFSAGVGLGIKL